MNESNLLDTWFAFGAASGLKAGILLAVAWCVATALRGRPAAERHLVWVLALTAVTLLPLASLGMPQLRWLIHLPVAPSVTGVQPGDVASPAARFARDTPVQRPILRAKFQTTETAWIGEGGSADIAAISHSTHGSPTARLLGTARRHPIRASLVLLWLSGALLVVGRNAAGAIVVRRVAARAPRLRSRRLTSLCTRLRSESRISRRVELIEGPAGSSPMVVGTLTPAILLPRDATTWPASTQEIVLRHELGHISRKDPLTGLAGVAASALYWFNPLVWVAVHRLQIEREHACDDIVVMSGIRPSSYAGELIDIAKNILHRRPIPGSKGFATARPAEMHLRVAALLDGRKRSLGVSNRAVLTGLSLAVLGLLILSACAPEVTVVRPDVSQSQREAFAVDGVSQPRRSTPPEEATVAPGSSEPIADGSTAGVGGTSRLAIQERLRRDVTDAVLDRRGRVFILDGRSAELVLADSTLNEVLVVNLSGSADRQSSDPIALGLLGDDRIAVLDRASRRIDILNTSADGQSVAIVAIVELDMVPEAMCVIGSDEFLVYGLHQRNRLHVYNRGGELVRSFAPVPSGQSEMVASMLARGRIACDGDNDEVLISATSFMPSVEAYSLSGGQQLWEDTLEPFREVRFEAGPDAVSIVSGGSGHSSVSSVVSLGEYRVFQADFNARPGPVPVADTVVTYVYSRAQGQWLMASRALPFIRPLDDFSALLVPPPTDAERGITRTDRETLLENLAGSARGR